MLNTCNGNKQHFPKYVTGLAGCLFVLHVLYWRLIITWHYIKIDFTQCVGCSLWYWIKLESESNLSLSFSPSHTNLKHHFCTIDPGMDMNCKVSLLVFEWSHVKDIYSPYILSILGSHSQYLRPERLENCIRRH